MTHRACDWVFQGQGFQHHSGSVPPGTFLAWKFHFATAFSTHGVSKNRSKQGTHQQEIHTPSVVTNPWGRDTVSRPAYSAFTKPGFSKFMPIITNSPRHRTFVSVAIMNQVCRLWKGVTHNIVHTHCTDPACVHRHFCSHNLFATKELGTSLLSCW